MFTHGELTSFIRKYIWERLPWVRLKQELQSARTQIAELAQNQKPSAWATLNEKYLLATAQKELAEERKASGANREEILGHKLEIQTLKDEKRRLLEAQSEPCPGCKRRDSMVADRAYSMLTILAQDTANISQRYSELSLDPASKPLEGSSFPYHGSDTSWDYAKRMRRFLKDDLDALIKKTDYFWSVLDYGRPEVLDPARNHGVTSEELQKTLVRFTERLEVKLNEIKPQLTQEYQRVTPYRR